MAAEETVRAFYDALNSGRLEDALGLLAADVRWSRPPDVPVTGTLEGVAEVRRMWVALSESLESFEVVPTGFEASGSALLAIVTMRGTAPDGRGDFEFGGCQVFRMREGEIAEVREFRSLPEARELLS
jgi:ketosteroid isomerase-like protein